MCRVERQGRQHRKHDVLEVGRELLAALGLDLVPLEDPHAGFGEPRPKIFGKRPDRQRRILLDDFADHPELLMSRQAVGAALGHRRLDLLVQARDPDHEELVEIRVEDREELDPFEQRPARVERFLEHPPVEGEPRDLAIEIKRVVVEAIVRSARASNELHFAHRGAPPPERRGKVPLSGWATVKPAREKAIGPGFVEFILSMNWHSSCSWKEAWR